MKKLILLLLLSLSFIGFSYAGGDDRDQEEFLNEPADVVEEEAKSFLEFFLTIMVEKLVSN